MSTKPSLGDRLKVAMLIKMRESHKKTVEHKSVADFRRRRVAVSPPPRLTPVNRIYKGMSWMPAAMLVPERVPKEARLPNKYYVTYYGSSKAIWKIYANSPINPELDWIAGSKWNEAFPTANEGWGSPTDDDAFAALRLQGSNPFCLKKVDHDAAVDGATDNAAEEKVFSLDFTELFRDILPPVEARFAVREKEFVATSIRLDDAIHRPGDAGWDDAKRVVNGLDARYSAFIRHLLNCHLMVGEAYAVAAFTLPPHHPLRPFMDFFTYSTIHVNHTAYTALLTENSYFLQANFVSADSARILVENAMRVFDFDEWILPRDLAKRKIDEIPGHPYVEDATAVWPAIEHVCRRHLKELDYDDEMLAADADLAQWYTTLCRMLPDVDTIPPMNTLEDLIDLLTAVIYNNVIHEVCGNLSPLLDTKDPRDKQSIDIEHLADLARSAGTEPGRKRPKPWAASVLLMDQATFVSRFNVAGNNLMKINAARYIDDPKLVLAVTELQDTLKVLDAQIAARNVERDRPFETMLPRKWEASISF